MEAILARARAEYRSRWRAWAALGVMVGLLSGFVIAAAAGARRTDSAYPRFLQWSNTFDVLVPSLPPPLPRIDLDKIAALPQVRQSQKLTTLVMMRNNDASDGFAFAAPQPGPTTVSRPKVLQGRLPVAESLDEVAVSTFDLKRLGARVGGTVTLEGLPLSGSGSPQAVFGQQNAPPQSKVLTFTFHVVGVVVSATDFPTSGAAGATSVVSPAFADRYRGAFTTIDSLMVKLRGGTSAQPQFMQGVEKQLGSAVAQQNFDVVTIGPQLQAIQRSFHLQAVALWILAGAAGLTMLVVFSQLLARHVFIESSDFPSIRALGMTRAQLVGLTLVRSALIASTASVGAIAVSYALSPIAPIGGPRLAEPHPGFAFDAAAIGVGVVAVIVLVIGCTAFAGWRAARGAMAGLGTAEVSNAKPSAAAAALSRTPMPAAAVAGVRLGLEPGHGHTAVPVRTTLISVGVGLAALVGALTFGRSLTHLTSTPRLYGVGWDTEIDAMSDSDVPPDVRSQLVPLVRAQPGVKGIAVGGADITVKVSDANVDPGLHGIAADALAYQNVEGSVVPDALAGRLPVAPGEVALGAKTLAALHKHIGDTVALDIANGFVKVKFRIVGVVVVPPFSSTARLGQGSMFSYTETSLFKEAPPPSVMWVRFSSPAAKRAALAVVRARVRSAQIYGIPTPDDIVNLGKLSSLPLVLAGLLALLAAATLAQAIVTAVRRRRRDLAILKTLGFVRAQVRRTVAWQTGSMTVIAMVIAIPAGIAIGRALWDLLASQLGIKAEPVVPAVSVGLVVPAAIALALIIAWLPGRVAARTRPAVILRTE